MEEFPVIHLRGQLGSLGNSIIQRLLREKVQIVLDSNDFEIAKAQFSTELEFSESLVVEATDCQIKSGHRVVLLGFLGYGNAADDSEMGIEVDGAEVILVTPSSIETLEVDTSNIDSHIIIHDMIPNDSSEPWGNKFMDGIMASLTSGAELLEVFSDRYLVSELDVADAISMLLMCKNPTPSKLNICGRRAWAQGQVRQELEILYNRTMAGQTGDFSSESLTSPSTPNIEIISKNDIVEARRPNLEALHLALVEGGYEGWRPSIPIRTALMHFLIGKLN
jgi:hypothetical protein